MIIVGIGQSGSGKTTYFKERYVKPPISHVEDEICPYTVADGIALIGRYNIGKRTEGTDSLSYSILPKLIQQVEVLTKKYPIIIVEGDRINNTRFFEYLVKSGQQVHLILFTCPLETSVKRLEAAGSKITLPFIKTTKTKSLNNFMKYGRQFFRRETMVNS